MKNTYDLSVLEWSLTGFVPFQWALLRSMETGATLISEVPTVEAQVPGSVQEALRKAEILPDWNCGLNYRSCEWVENRHWCFQACIPDSYFQKGSSHRLNCQGLDGSGWLLLNGVEIGRFSNAFVPHIFDLKDGLGENNNKIQIIFDCPPRWLGQIGYTSQITEWKPRFNYTWDWVPRLVQIGIWDEISLEVTDGREISNAKCWTDGESLNVSACGGKMRLTLKDGDKVLRTGNFTENIVWKDLPVEKWWPNGCGQQKLYTVTCEFPDACEIRTWRVGFKSVEWHQCENAPEKADPWICAINGKAIFLQGVNWTPIKPNFADVTEGDYHKRLAAYRDMGCNIIRVWGGAVLEKEVFYEICDELGLMVWQEFPLSSSGIDNWPPEEPKAIEDMAGIAESYVSRRQHHVSLLLWCGGNELQGGLDGSKVGCGKPVDDGHPLIARIKKVLEEMDPSRRFLPTSSSGPRFYAEAHNYGKGLHWDVHGPWIAVPKEYWEQDDALFRSEVGMLGTSSVEIIREFTGGIPELPVSFENPIWRLSTWFISTQWMGWLKYQTETGREIRTLEEFAVWSQMKQAEGLAFAVRTCKRRFPKCGGIIIWMGHDCFPCAVNLSLLDVHGDPKPAALAVGEIFRTENKP